MVERAKTGKPGDTKIAYVTWALCGLRMRSRATRRRIYVFIFTATWLDGAPLLRHGLIE